MIADIPDARAAFDAVYGTLNSLLGLELESRQINAWQMSLRAIVVFIAATAMIRIGNKRFMGQNTALDVLLGIVFGSLVSRAITGTSPFFPTLAAGLTLVVFHWLLSAIAFRSHRFGTLFKGTQHVLVENGEIRWDMMKKSHITEHDLHEALRNCGKDTNITLIKSAHLERNGDISIISK